MSRVRAIRQVAIISAKRTPIGAFQGGLSSIPATRLGAAAITAALESGNIAPEDVDEVILVGGMTRLPKVQETTLLHDRYLV